MRGCPERAMRSTMMPCACSQRIVSAGTSSTITQTSPSWPMRRSEPMKGSSGPTECLVEKPRIRFFLLLTQLPWLMDQTSGRAGPRQRRCQTCPGQSGEAEGTGLCPISPKGNRVKRWSTRHAAMLPLPRSGGGLGRGFVMSEYPSPPSPASRERGHGGAVRVICTFTRLPYRAEPAPSASPVYPATYGAFCRSTLEPWLWT
jgi:hypothetical protein